MRNKLFSLLIIFCLLTGCLPVTQPTNTPATDTTHATPEPIPNPTPDFLGIPTTPTPGMEESMPELATALKSCEGGESFEIDKVTILACNGYTLNQQIAGSVFAFSAVGYALSAEAFTASGAQIVGMLTFGGEAIGFIAFMEIAVPIIIIGGVTYLAVTSMIALQEQSALIDPLIGTWGNRYPPIVTNVRRDEVGVMPIPPNFLTDQWGEVLKALKVRNGLTAVILEDDVLLATMTTLALNQIGITVIGIFPTCESWEVTRMVASIYVVDNIFVGGAKRGSACAASIVAVAPTAMLIIHSSAYPDLPSADSIGSKSLREGFESVASPENVVGGVEKDLYMQKLVEEIARLLGGG